MRYSYRSCGLFFLTIVLLASQLPVSRGQPPQEALPDTGPAAANAPGEDVLTRGPLHEAFAQPANLSGAVPPVVTNQPPNPIDETPAAYQPEGGNAVWIPGYWDWDDQRSDFIWVSGIWRNPPPDHQWIGGYWSQTPNGFQRTPGFWTTADTEEVQYFPQPPAPQEQGPTTDPPTGDAMWVPGNWNWQRNGFAWNSGFWTAGRPGWVWSPTSYSWTPRGYVLVNGFWDYDLGRRGLVFAPVAFTQPVYQRPGFAYTPSLVINPGILSFYLFARPAFGQYYFGDYFGTEYDRLGYYPWYAVNRRGAFRYDPLFAYDHWYYASRDPHWIDNLERWHSYYRDHPDARPPHDFAQEQRLAAERTDRADRRFLSIGQPINSIARNSAFPVRVAPVTAADRTRALDIVRSQQAFQSQRSRMEAAAGRTNAPGKAALPHREHAIVGQRTLPNALGQGARPENQPVQPGRTPPNMTGARQPGQQEPNRREAFKPVVPGGETPAPVNPNRGRPGAGPQPTPRPNQEFRGNPEPIRPQPEQRRPEPQPQQRPGQEFRGNPQPIRPQTENRRPEPQPQQRQAQPQNAPRHPQAPNTTPTGRGETRQPTPERSQPAPRPEHSQPAPRTEHNQPAPARGGDREKKPGNG
jgi:hypothetical protein